MARLGYSPATRVFEAAGAGACIITDAWRGIECFFTPGEEILVAGDGAEMAELLRGLTPKKPPKSGRPHWHGCARNTVTPSVRLFEAAACGVPVISDRWPGLETLFTPGEEILIADNADDVLDVLRDLPGDERIAMGHRSRRRVLNHHTAAHRAQELVGHLKGAGTLHYSYNGAPAL